MPEFKLGIYENRAVSVAAVAPGEWNKFAEDCNCASFMINCPSTAEMTIEVTNAETIDGSEAYVEWSSGRSTAGATVAGIVSMPMTYWRWRTTVLKAGTVATVQMVQRRQGW
jgi:hypothetical protein